MELTIQQADKFKFVEKGEGQVLLLLHGLFGALSNFSALIDCFSKTHKVIVPLLPIYELPIRASGLTNLVNYVEEFVQYKNYSSVIVLGNSLGGHIALMYALKQPEKVKAMVLTGSSGLFENAMGDSFPQRSNYEFIKKKTEFTFYDPAIATKELVDEVFGIVNDREKAIRVIHVAKSAIRHNMSDEIPKIEAQTLLIWGKNDNITPPFVAEDFLKKMPCAELHFIDQCGHAPMMEQPEAFNAILVDFLTKLE